MIHAPCWLPICNGNDVHVCFIYKRRLPHRDLFWPSVLFSAPGVGSVHQTTETDRYPWAALHHPKTVARYWCLKGPHVESCVCTWKGTCTTNVSTARQVWVTLGKWDSLLKAASGNQGNSTQIKQHSYPVYVKCVLSDLILKLPVKLYKSIYWLYFSCWRWRYLFCCTTEICQKPLFWARNQVMLA